MFVEGTRVPVSRIIGGLAGGMTIEEIIKEYEITEDDIRVVSKNNSVNLLFM
jgi:uncharacterized protein (DUF433 family)